MHAREARLARAHTKRKLKFTLPGPMTIVDTIADAHYGDRVKMAMAFAALLNEEARALAADGVDVIQFDEPAFNVYMDEVKTWGIEALHRAIDGARLHHRRAHLLRLRHQGQYRLEGDARLRVAAIREDFSRRSPRAGSTRCRSSASIRACRCSLLKLLDGKDVLIGVIDVATDTVETPEEVAAVIGEAMKYTSPKERSSPAPIAAWRRCAATSPRQARGARQGRRAGADGVSRPGIELERSLGQPARPQPVDEDAQPVGRPEIVIDALDAQRRRGFDFCAGFGFCASAPSSSVRPRQHVDQLAHLAALVGLVAGRDRVLDTMGDVIAQDFLLDPAQRRPRRRDLGDDVDAIAVVLDHAGEAADLSLDPVQALEHRRLGIRSHARYIPLPGIRFKRVGRWNRWRIINAGGSAVDPVCGMSVDPAHDAASPQLSGPTPIISAPPAAAASSPPIRKNISGDQRAP